jgi:hypothetical protein
MPPAERKRQASSCVIRAREKEDSQARNPALGSTCFDHLFCFRLFMSFGDRLRVARVAAAFWIAALLVAGAPNEAAAQLNDVSNATNYFSGNVGIGITTPGSLLNIVDGASNTPSVKFSYSGQPTTYNNAIVNGGWGSASSQYMEFQMKVGISTITPLTLLQNGDVGIGTTSPSYLLHVGSSSASGAVAGGGILDRRRVPLRRVRKPHRPAAAPSRIGSAQFYKRRRNSACASSYQGCSPDFRSSTARRSIRQCADTPRQAQPPL